jgi:Copper-binding of amyloid precursor, CuBD
MQMRSFAMLLPCGISLFSGVEFVCCPKHFKGERDIRFFDYYYRTVLDTLLSVISVEALVASIHQREALWEKNFITQFIFPSHIDIYLSATRRSFCFEKKKIYFDNIFHLFV